MRDDFAKADRLERDPRCQWVLRQERSRHARISSQGEARMKRRQVIVSLALLAAGGVVGVDACRTAGMRRRARAGARHRAEARQGSGAAHVRTACAVSARCVPVGEGGVLSAFGGGEGAVARDVSRRVAAGRVNDGAARALRSRSLTRFWRSSKRRDEALARYAHVRASAFIKPRAQPQPVVTVVNLPPS